MSWGGTFFAFPGLKPTTIFSENGHYDCLKRKKAEKKVPQTGINDLSSKKAILRECFCTLHISAGKDAERDR